jgi:ATP-dependent DNA ligase
MVRSNANDWTDRHRGICPAAGKLRCLSALIDGEVIVQDEDGLSDFHPLRSAIGSEPHRIGGMNRLSFRQRPRPRAIWTDS